MNVVLETRYPRLFARGKVRDTYDLGSELLIVATDRLSAFDVILPTGIPDKGAVLTQLSAFWLERTRNVIANHYGRVVRSEDLDGLAGELGTARSELLPLLGRSMIVRKAQRIDIECVVRGYLAGSAWEEYRKAGTVCGSPLPAGLVESQKLDQPIFTPSTKAESGHDMNIGVDEMRRLVGADLTSKLSEASIAVYLEADAYARSRGLIIADTKMEFGLVDGELILIDELLTPDSSRFWDINEYEPGRPQSSFDKQFVRDWLTASGWDREPPAPVLPPEIVNGTAEKYREAFRRLAGRELEPCG
ncbi:MAG: phosphoribosylaminoimidazolesuccinocarboxamide synthase [Chloroflexota bacterium]|nr:MAG: phosphoribosylaminoimidazolesuccinocarboxamide synthase [Chloroflexota bacterium]